MQIQTIKRGSSGPLVRKWQDFMRGAGLYFGGSDGKFGPDTEAATKKYQAQKGAWPVDGIVGNATWGFAMSEGLELVETKSKGMDSPTWPAMPTDLKPVSQVGRQKLFGAFTFKPAPTRGNPEGITITGSWQKDNLTSVVVPQLKGITGAGSGKVFWHRAAVPQLLGLFEAWEAAGLLDRVQGWAGSWCARFSRGSTTYLSNHSWGTAFDINVPQNMLGRRPALVGQPGSVRELVPLANELGFWWGGHGWPPNFARLDGMHFEVAKLLTADEIEGVVESAG